MSNVVKIIVRAEQYMRSSLHPDGAKWVRRHARQPAHATSCAASTLWVRWVSMPLPRWLARFNLHVTNRILGPLARFAPWIAIVAHIGRKSHRRYRTPVVIFRRGDHFLIALTYGPESQWVQNVLAQGGCELEIMGRTLRLAEPRILHDPAADDAVTRSHGLGVTERLSLP